MKISNKTKLKLFILLIVLNVVLRYPVPFQEIGDDSFEVHIVANSISQFGEARWLLSPLSIFGMYPMSVQGAVPFILSGFSQSSGIKMEWVVFIIPLLMGLFSIFTSYLIAKVINDDDLFKFLVAFVFSTSSGIVTYSTYTITNRGIFLILMPIFVYLLLKWRSSALKYTPLIFIFFILLFITHHMVYFLFPFIVGTASVLIYYKCNKYFNLIKIANLHRFFPFFIIFLFILMFFYPFFTGFLVEGSRYQTPVEIFSNSTRYIGILFIFSFGGLIYLIFKNNKSFEEWAFIMSLIFLAPSLYSLTYTKWFILIFLSLLIGIGLTNILYKLYFNNPKKITTIVIIVILLVFTPSFTGYYQFMHVYREGVNFKRYVEDSTFAAGLWMRDNANGYAVANDMFSGKRLFAISNVPFITSMNTIDQIYGFISIHDLDFVTADITSEKFWYDTFIIKGADPSEVKWARINRLDGISPSDFNLSYVVENTRTQGNTISNHGVIPSGLLQYVYKERSRIYDNGDTDIWALSQ